MAVFSGINNTSAFNPGFTFSDWDASMSSAADSLNSLASALQSSASGYGQYDDGSYWVDWSDGTSLWFTGSYNPSTKTAAIKEFEFSSSSGLAIGFTGKATATLDTSTDTVSMGAITAKEVWIDTGDGYAIDYRGSLKLDLDSGIVSGSIKELYLVGDDGTVGDDSAYYVKLGGSVKADTEGNFTGGKISSIEWGNVTFPDDGDPILSVSGKVTGLKIDASAIQSDDFDSFDDLMALAYSGNDKVTGSAGDDTLDAGTGNDKVYALAGDDTVYGGAGNDQLEGGDGNDQLYGGDGNDKLTGGAGNDSVYGGNGNDKLDGGDGNDLLAGGLGNDVLAGGTGNDYFVFNEGNFAAIGIDKIKDFTSGADKLWFDLDVYTALAGITADNFTTAKTGDADDVLIYTGGKLYYDADASGTEAAVLIAQVKGLQFGDLAFGTDASEISLV